MWKQGEKVKLSEYMAFCKEIMGRARCPVVFAALDVIPGVNGRNPTSSEIQKACDEGWENYQTMKQEGIRPCLMTYHQFEHKRQLVRIADDSEYFAVSPRKSGVGSAEKSKWLGQIFNYIQGTDTLDIRKKIHGLGVSSIDWMGRFPFYSVDNTGWIPATRAHLRRHIAGRRPVYLSLDQWKRRARKDGIPTRFLREILGYGVPGEKPDQNGNSGAYWLVYLAMECEVEMQWRITKHWRDQGLVWDEEPAKTRWEIFQEKLREKERPIDEAHLEALAASYARWNAGVEKQISDPELVQWLGLKEK